MIYLQDTTTDALELIRSMGDMMDISPVRDFVPLPYSTEWEAPLKANSTYTSERMEVTHENNSYTRTATPDKCSQVGSHRLCTGVVPPLVTVIPCGSTAGG
jgi:hypothetical protein